MDNQVIRSEMAKVLHRIIKNQDCDECPLRKACDVYQQESETGSYDICYLLSEEMK